jgi:hypothetical protein
VAIFFCASAVAWAPPYPYERDGALRLRAAMFTAVSFARQQFPCIEWNTHQMPQNHATSSNVATPKNYFPESRIVCLLRSGVFAFNAPLPRGGR